MLMPDRTYSSPSYRYGFNGKEKDDETYGVGGSSYDYGFRIYNSRLGRFLSVDPITAKYPELTPYQFASNTPIQAIDLDGLEALFVHGTFSSSGAAWEDKNFVKSMLTATNWNKVANSCYFGSWSGANNSKARVSAANGFYKWLTSEKNPHRELKHATLIGHSHGGNVNKILKNKLEKAGWTVDIINIETPQRKDFQSDQNGSGIYLNFYNNNDIVQKMGAAGNEGPLGARLDPNADRNIELIGSIPVVMPSDPLPIPFNSVKQWFKDSGGHSLQNNELANSIIVSQTTVEFSKTQNTPAPASNGSQSPDKTIEKQ